MPEQQAQRTRSFRRAVIRKVLVVWSALVVGCAPDAVPIERSSGGSATAGSDSTPEPPASSSAVLPTAPSVRSTAPAAGRRRPDVLLVSLDTLRADALGCYGNPRPTSPNIDAFAARGVRFARCYAPAPHTAPSHVSLFSGLLPAAHGVPNASEQSTRLATLNANCPTLTEELARAGYQTMFVANQGQLRKQMGLGRGVDQFDSSTNTFVEAQKVVATMLTDVAREEPLFAFVHTYEPHAPYLPPRHAKGEVLHGRFTSATYDGVLRARYDELVERASEGTALAHVFLEGAEEFTPADVEFLVGLYHEDVAWTDILLTRLLATWAQHRDLSNTIVVIVSDHGEQLGERGAFGHSFGLEVELVHVPFIAFGPGIEARVDEGVVSLAGVAAAILEHVGLEAPAHFERGVRLASASPTSGVAHLQDVFGRRASLGVVDGHLQYQRSHGANRGIDEWARDLEADPHGLQEVELDADVLTHLRALVTARNGVDKELRTRFPVVFDEVPSRRQLELLRDLGYAGGAASQERPADGAGGKRER